MPVIFKNKLEHLLDLMEVINLKMKNLEDQLEIQENLFVNVLDII